MIGSTPYASMRASFHPGPSFHSVDTDATMMSRSASDGAGSPAWGDGAMTSRHGPLMSLAGATPALALGDVEMRHLRMTPAGVAWHRAETRREFALWADVARISVDPPATWWPHPLVGDWVVPMIEGVFGGGGEVREPEPYFAHVRIGEGDEELWEIDRHYISGYRRRDAQSTARLVDHLASTPGSRALLAHPDAVIARISAIVRPAT